MSGDIMKSSNENLIVNINARLATLYKQQTARRLLAPVDQPLSDSNYLVDLSIIKGMISSLEWVKAELEKNA